MAAPSVFETFPTMHTHPETFKENADYGSQNHLSSQELCLGRVQGWKWGEIDPLPEAH